MATVPKVKVTFDADLDGLKRGTASAENELDGFGKTVQKFGEMAKAAFAAAAAAAAAYAVKLGVDGVKAAIEDEQAQSKLARTLQVAAGATNEQVKATEAFITKMQLATGVADNDLRNAMNRLTLSTNDVGKSQELLSLALDISKGSGKSLETVANALGKAYDGQTTSLGKLGLGLSSAELKGASFTDVQKKLSDLFGGAASRNADTFQGKIDVMKQRFAEFQEGIGYALMPILMKLFEMIDTKLVPAFEWLKTNALDPVANAVKKNWDTFSGLFEFLAKTFVPFFGGALAVAISTLGKAAGFIVEAVAAGIRALEPLINFTITGINKIITGLNWINPMKDIPYVPKLDTSGAAATAASVKVPTFTAPTVSIPTTSTSSTGTSIATTKTVAAASTVAVTAGNAPTSISSGSYLSTATAPTPISSGSYLSGGVTINVNAPSVIDEQGFTQAVVSALNNSTYRGVSGAGMLAGLNAP